jgi:hypothetical protein
MVPFSYSGQAGKWKRNPPCVTGPHLSCGTMACGIATSLKKAQ